jgi:hypothetical protein
MAPEVLGIRVSIARRNHMFVALDRQGLLGAVAVVVAMLHEQSAAS